MSKVLSYLEENKYKIYKRKQNIVKVLSDNSCSMKMVTLNNQGIMMGNTWDFHPGCHGFPFTFSGATSLAEKIKNSIPNAVIVYENWKYED